MKFNPKDAPADEPHVVWSPEGDRYDILTELEWNWLRSEIVRHRESGWRIETDCSYTDIGPDGIPAEEIPGVFDSNSKLLAYILEWGIFDESDDCRKELTDEDVIYERIERK